MPSDDFLGVLYGIPVTSDQLWRIVEPTDKDCAKRGQHALHGHIVRVVRVPYGHNSDVVGVVSVFPGYTRSDGTQAVVSCNIVRLEPFDKEVTHACPDAIREPL